MGGGGVLTQPAVPVYAYLFSLFTGFSPQEMSTVGIEIGYTYNTYIRETQIQASPGGAWQTYYAAYRYDYFRYDRATVVNDKGYDPPLYHDSISPEPGAPPYRQGLSPNYNNHGELSTRGSLLYLNWCPAGWENEDLVYYPLDQA